jgi:hypothetical protein
MSWYRRFLLGDILSSIISTSLGYKPSRKYLLIAWFLLAFEAKGLSIVLIKPLPFS